MGRNLSRKEIIDNASILTKQPLLDMGYELVEVDYVKELGDYYLRIFAYHEDGIGLEDCEKITRIVSDILDEKDLIPGAYYLEVSSPGLDRPISTNDDFRRSINKDIEVRLYKAIEGIKIYDGKLISYDDDNITIINKEEKELVIPREAISLVKLVINF